MVVYLILIIIIVLTWWVMRQTTYEGGSRKTSREQIVKKLKERKFRLFTKTGCVWCDKQKEIVGEDFPFVESADIPDDLDVKAYPTWEKNGKLYPGCKTLEELEEMLNE